MSAGTLTAAELLARAEALLADIPPDPLHGATWITVHPSRYDEMKAALGIASRPSYLNAALPLLSVATSSFAMKDRGVLSTTDRRVVGIYVFTTGQFYFFDKKSAACGKSAENRRVEDMTSGIKTPFGGEYETTQAPEQKPEEAADEHLRAAAGVGKRSPIPKVPPETELEHQQRTGHVLYGRGLCQVCGAMCIRLLENRTEHAARTGHCDFTSDGGGTAQCRVPGCLQIVTTDDAPNVVASHQSVIDAWGIPAGQVMVVRDRVEKAHGEYVASRVVRDDGSSATILGTQYRGDMEQTFQPWATVLMVGDPYITDYGQTIQPPPVKPGMRVLIVATAAEDVDLEAGGETMRVTLVSFRAIKLWKKEGA